jgi:hypothetical protein
MRAHARSTAPTRRRLEFTPTNAPRGARRARHRRTAGRHPQHQSPRKSAQAPASSARCLAAGACAPPPTPTRPHARAGVPKSPPNEARAADARAAGAPSGASRRTSRRQQQRRRARARAARNCRNCKPTHAQARARARAQDVSRAAPSLHGAFQRSAAAARRQGGDGVDEAAHRACAAPQRSQPLRGARARALTRVAQLTLTKRTQRAACARPPAAAGGAAAGGAAVLRAAKALRYAGSVRARASRALHVRAQLARALYRAGAHFPLPSTQQARAPRCLATAPQAAAPRQTQALLSRLALPKCGALEHARAHSRARTRKQPGSSTSPAAEAAPRR